MKYTANCQKSIICFIFFLLSTAVTQAQWIPAIPQDADTAGLYDMQVSVNDPDVAWGVLSRWLVDEDSYLPISNEYLPVVRTTDGGQTWSTSRLQFGFAPFPSSISSLDAQTAVISGVDANFNNFVMVTHNGGLGWGRINEETYRLPTSFVNAVHFYDQENGVAIGDPAKRGVDTVLSFEIYTISDKGKTWTRIPPEHIPVPDSNELGGPAYYSFVGDHIWFGTVDYGTGRPHRIFHSADRGRHWTAKRSDLTKIHFSDERNGLASSDQALAITADGGETWTQLNLPSGYYLNSAALIPDSLHIVATFRDKNLSGPFETWLSRDQGAHWTKIDSTANVGVVRFATNGNGYGGEYQPADRPTRMFRYRAPVTTKAIQAAVYEKIWVAPSVGTDQVQAYLPQALEAGRLLILDMNGREILQIHTVAGQRTVEVNIQNLTPGKYIIRYEYGGKTGIGRLIKQ